MTNNRKYITNITTGGRLAPYAKRYGRNRHPGRTVRIAGNRCRTKQGAGCICPGEGRSSNSESKPGEARSLRSWPGASVSGIYLREGKVKAKCLWNRGKQYELYRSIPVERKGSAISPNFGFSGHAARLCGLLYLNRTRHRA